MQYGRRRLRTLPGPPRPHPRDWVRSRACSLHIKDRRPAGERGPAAPGRGFAPAVRPAGRRSVRDRARREDGEAVDQSEGRDREQEAAEGRSRPGHVADGGRLGESRREARPGVMGLDVSARRQTLRHLRRRRFRPAIPALHGLASLALAHVATHRNHTYSPDRVDPDAEDRDPAGSARRGRRSGGAVAQPQVWTTWVTTPARLPLRVRPRKSRG